MSDDYWLGEVFDSVKRSALYVMGSAESRLKAAVLESPGKDAIAFICRDYSRYASRVADGRTHHSERVIYSQISRLIETWDRLCHEHPKIAERMQNDTFQSSEKGIEARF